MKRLEALSSEYTVPKPRERLNEFGVQAWLYMKLLERGFDVRGEVRWIKTTRPREVCRFDLVIYENGAAVEIVEIKWGPVKHKQGVESTRQGKRYRKFGVPVVFIYGIEDAETYLREKNDARN